MKSLFKERITEALDLEMVHVEGGTFRMGEDEYWNYVPHEVK